MDLSQFSPESRVWVYPLSKTLNSDELLILEQKLAEFVSNWKAHAEPVRGVYQIVENRFIIITADSNCTAASGCSIDGMRKAVVDALNPISTEIADTSSIFYLSEGEIKQVSREEFSKLRAKGDVSNEHLVYDLVPANLGIFLKNGIRLRCGESWHSRLS